MKHNSSIDSCNEVVSLDSSVESRSIRPHSTNLIFCTDEKLSLVFVYYNHTFSQIPFSFLVVKIPLNLPKFSKTSTPPMRENPQASFGPFLVKVGNSFLASRSQPKMAPFFWWIRSHIKLLTSIFGITFKKIWMIESHKIFLWKGVPWLLMGQQQLS